MATSIKTPQDRKPRQAEAKGEDIVFDYDGETYTVLRENLDNLELFEAIEDQQYIKATRGFIGRDQWEKFKNHYRTEDGRVPMEPLEGFLEALMEAVGQGN